MHLVWFQRFGRLDLYTDRTGGGIDVLPAIPVTGPSWQGWELIIVTDFGGTLSVL